ncbi:unnamed protein product [Protopolystoma xenopodis]|uniref:Uncharacterized protein n=1 Tax=Protopolystoma xenopodis TaxID=117903 RepID=A0A3S5AFH7_9PLAT|nr:unnamed protein product [Protopolystoma xenopodis]
MRSNCHGYHPRKRRGWAPNLTANGIVLRLMRDDGKEDANGEARTSEWNFPSTLKSGMCHEDPWPFEHTSNKHEAWSQVKTGLDSSSSFLGTEHPSV